MATAVDILIDKFLKDVEENGTFSWQRPYQVMMPFNWVTMKPYRGFNRILLPMGEYITKNQLNQVNRDRGWDYRFQKGIKWWSVTFFKKDKKQVSEAEVADKFDDYANKEGFIGRDGVWAYFFSGGIFYKQRNVLQYYDVCDIKFLRNSKGEPFPSRIESGEIEMVLREPREVFDSYIDREGIMLDDTHNGVPCYIPALDAIQLNPRMVGENEYWSTAFHEAGHSTGAENRLNREGVAGKIRKGTDEYAKEECIAEICAGLCCAECGVYTFETSEHKAYENNLSYVQSYKKRIKDWGSAFIYIASQAEEAFNYIMGYDED